jgi:hypothetical protein
MQRAIQRSRFELDLAVGETLDLGEDRVAVPLFGSKREQDVELDAAQSHINAPRLYAPRTDCQRNLRRKTAPES